MSFPWRWAVAIGASVQHRNDAGSGWLLVSQQISNTLPWHRIGGPLVLTVYFDIRWLPLQSHSGTSLHRFAAVIWYLPGVYPADLI